MLLVFIGILIAVFGRNFATVNPAFAAYKRLMSFAGIAMIALEYV